MPEVTVAIPGDLATPTGGYIYARRIIAALPATGWQPHLLTLPASFPFPRSADLQAVDAAFASLTPGTLVLVDGLAFGALPDAILRAHDLRYVALIHHPLAAETGLKAETRAALAASERAALTCAAHVIATSAHTATQLTVDYGVAAEKITIARPGTDPAPRASGSGHQPLLLSVGTLTPRKGHVDLIAALAALRDLPWRAAFVGSATRDPETAAMVQNTIRQHDLANRITLHGEVSADALAAFYAAADIFVLASRHEGYGMAFAEALAHGLPVVGYAVGAVPDTVPADAGLLIADANPQAFSEALARLIQDQALRKRMSDASAQAGARLPRWSDTGADIARALESLR